MPLTAEIWRRYRNWAKTDDISIDNIDQSDGIILSDHFG